MKLVYRYTLAGIMVFFLFLVSCTSNQSWGSYGLELDSLSPEQWVHDIDTLEKELLRRHPNPFHTTQEAVFLHALEDLRNLALTQSLEGQALADAMVTGIYSALALLQEGHTTLNASPEIQYPVLIRRFRNLDGAWELRVAYGNESLGSLVGTKVLSIGGREPFEVLSQVSELASAELAEGRIFFGQRLMTDPRIMRGLGIANADGLAIKVMTSDGEVEHLIEPLPRQNLNLVSPTLDSQDLGPRYQQSLSFQGSGRFWYQVIDRTIYFRYNSSTTDAMAMMDEILDQVETGDIQRLILDLRFNGGGNSYPGTEFIRRLAQTDVGQQQGRFFVLVSENTFSSAIMTAVDAMDMTRAIFVGTPMATPVNGWGEVKRFGLPESGLVVGHSTKYWNYTQGKNLRLTEGLIVPDPGYEAIWTFDQWVQGFDPALELILSQTFSLE